MHAMITLLTFTGIHMQLQLDHKHLELQCRVEYFYAIDGVPAKGVKPEQLRLEHHRIFIQSTSQGSRCLKKGEKLLYLEEVNKYQYTLSLHNRKAYINILIFPISHYINKPGVA